MTGRNHDPHTWSRSSDHLGNLANALKDLGGGATLLYELVQNANDAKANRISFTTSGEGLTVWNSGVFSDCRHQGLPRCPWKTEEQRRSCDFHSFRQVAGRHKADDDSTTGAFGIGFTAVYQVTDHPELVTGGRHLVLDESRSEVERIQLCPGGCARDHATDGTTLYLPWAREQTALRRDLGASTLSDLDIDELTSQMFEAAGQALVFLESVQRLEVVTSSRLTTVNREVKGGHLTLTIDDMPHEWLLMEGAADPAKRLRERYDQGQSRSEVVQVAVPLDGEVSGRIFADLPTETPTGWCGHINGSFFPRQDRKTVEFDGSGFRGKWNDMLVDAAAKVMVDHLESIATTLGHRVAWAYLLDAEIISRSIAGGGNPGAFAAFFTRAKGLVRTSRIALLADGTSVPPRGSIVPRDEVEYEAADVLMRLGLSIIDSTIRPQILQVTRTVYGIQQLSAPAVVDALLEAEVIQAWTPGSQTRLSHDDVEALLRLLEHLQERGKNILRDAGVEAAAIVPCVDGSFAPASEVSALEDDDRALFELLAPDLRIVDRDRLEGLCPSLIELCEDITPTRAIEIFEREKASLEVAPDQVLDWLGNHRALLSDEEMRARARALPIYPSTAGELLPLTRLSLPSDFDDVLGVAQVVDRDKIAGHTDLLRLLGASELDAIEYLRLHVATAAGAGEVSEGQVASILEIIYRHRRVLESDPSLRTALARAPLVPTHHGMRSAAEVHLPNRALSLIDAQALTAEIGGLAHHLVDTLVWLGVSRSPNDAVLSAAATRLSEQNALPEPEVVLAILNSLPNPLPGDGIPTSLRALTSVAWLPVEGGARSRPANVYAGFQRSLFESQGPHLGLSIAAQQDLSAVLDWLGVPKAPTTAMVVAHLRHCARKATPVNDQVFRMLGATKDESLVSALRHEACVQVGAGDFIEPAFVFWTDPELGKWARYLPPSHRQYQAFYDRVGVEESPTPAQLEEILRWISRASGNDRVGDGDRAVVHRCWELLDRQLPEAEVSIGRLSAVKSVVGPRDLLEKPNLLLFADGRRLAEKILLISQNLIRRDRATQGALIAAGVRAAEEVITAYVDDSLEFAEATELASVLADRRPAMERLIEAQRTDSSDFNLAALKDLRINVMPGLTVEYVTRFGGTQQVDEPRATEAIYLPEQHRLITRSQEMTRHLARELAMCIAPKADVSTTAPSILEILSVENLDEAMAVLDEYGVRDLDNSSWDLIPTSVATEIEAPANRSEDSSRDSDPVAEPSVALPSISGGSAASEKVPLVQSRPGDSPTAKRAMQTQRRSGASSVPNTSRLTSYVTFGESTRESEPGDEAAGNSQVDQAGVRRVLEYEEACGRFPEEQSHTNPGFDVLSRNVNGLVLRRIEIKSIGGPWTDRGVLLSSRQFDDARDHPDLYWLYVVEHADDDDACEIHRIRNPAGQVTKFGFDSGWRALDEPDVRRDNTGRPTVSGTRGLLGWTTGTTVD